MEESNPLLAPSDLPYGLPHFAEIVGNTEAFLTAFTEALAEHDREIAAITAHDAAPTWENVVEALEASGQALNRVAAIFFNLQGTDSDDELDAIAAQIVPKLSEHEDAIYHNATLYGLIKEVDPPADEESQRLHDDLLRRFRRHGADLDAAGKEALAQLNSRLSVLSEEFGRNLLADTRDNAVRFTDADHLEGLSRERLDAAAAYAREIGTDGYVIPLELPTVQSEQASLERPAARRRLFEAAGQRGEKSNIPVLLEIVRLRARRAALLGYATHADYVIEEETAGSAENALRMLQDLAPAAAANATSEYKVISEEAADRGEHVTAADWPYWEAKLRRRELKLDEKKLAEYLPLRQVLIDGVFRAANRLYGITISPRDDLEGYAEGVQVWEVTDAPERGGEGIGLLLTDYFARPSKRGGAWMSSFVDQSHLLGTKPVVVNVMNLNRPAGNVDSLSVSLTMDEVTTVFHEFGHALHGLLSDVKYPSFSGTNVPRDWVEFPSQINENWAYDPEILHSFARHPLTGQPLPDDLFEAVLKARSFGQGFATSEYLGAAIIDLAWHSLSEEEAAQVGDDVEAVNSFEAAAFEKAGLVVDHLQPRYRSPYFNHIFAGGYSAGYYSYLWAEALDADGFVHFTESGAAGEKESDEAARKAGERFREAILSRGASKDFTEAYRTFRGQDRDLAPLLERRGLSGTDVGDIVDGQ